MNKKLTPFIHGLSSLATAVLAFILPLNIVLGIQDYPIIYSLYGIISFVLLVDLGHNLYEVKKQKNDQYSSEIITQQHNTFWIVIDALGALPLGLLGFSSYISLVRLIKIVRIAQYQSVWNKKVIRFADYQRLGFFAFWILIITHWLACGWLALHDHSGVTDKTTVYLQSLYWCVVTLTTVGYGDIIPKTNAQTIYSMIVMIFGVGVYGYVIGNIANILSSRDPAKQVFLKNMEGLKGFVKYRQLPPDLQKRIRDYYAYIWQKRLGYDETEFLDGLAIGLREEVELLLKRGIVEKIPLFKGTGEAFLNDIALQLKPLVFIPGDTIIHEGDEGHEMYFVIKGKLRGYREDDPGNQFILQDGDFFGEISLLKNEPRTATIQSVTYTDLYVLQRDMFEVVLSKYPAIRKTIEDIAEKRLKSNLKK